MQEPEGEQLLKKYVANVKPKPRKAAHVGGAFPKAEDPLDKFRKMNKLGVDDSRDY